MTSSFKVGMRGLDIGCGEGRNEIYLAELGLDVDAFDISEAGIEKLKRIAAEKGIKVNAWAQDLNSFVFDNKYDVIICHGVLHLVEKHEWQRMIKDIKINTNPGGLNIIGVFTNTFPATPDLEIILLQ